MTLAGDWLRNSKLLTMTGTFQTTGSLALKFLLTTLLQLIFCWLEQKIYISCLMTIPMLSADATGDMIGNWEPIHTKSENDWRCFINAIRDNHYELAFERLDMHLRNLHKVTKVCSKSLESISRFAYNFFNFIQFP